MSTKKEKEKVSKQQDKVKTTILLNEEAAMKAIYNMKVITPQELARNMGVKISIANAFIKKLETQGIVRCVGGYSGHRIYQLVR